MYSCKTLKALIMSQFNHAVLYVSTYITKYALSSLPNIYFIIFGGSTDWNWEIQQHGNFNDLNVITLGQTLHDNNKQLITLIDQTLWVAGCKNAKVSTKIFGKLIILTE
jgi:hypothetical protein